MDYRNVSFVEYQKKKKEMLDDLGRIDEMCRGANCSICPFSRTNNGTDHNCIEYQEFYPERAIEIVMNYKSKVDWIKVPVDTKILVRNAEDDRWHKRYFAKYDHGKVYAFVNGRSSFTSESFNPQPWNYAILYKEYNSSNVIN